MSQMNPDKNDIENLVIGNLRQLRDELDKAQRFYEFFQELGVEGLTALEFDPQQSADIVAAYENLSSLHKVAYGETPDGAKNYFDPASKLWGLG